MWQVRDQIIEKWDELNEKKWLNFGGMSAKTIMIIY